MTEQKLAKDLSSVSNEPKADEMEIDLMDILRKIIAIRKTLYKAVGIGLVIGIIVALSIPKKYTVEVTLSPEMGHSKGNSGLASMAASFLGAGTGMSGDGVDALNASLSPEIVSSTPFLLELLSMSVPSGGEESEKIDLKNLEEGYLQICEEFPDCKVCKVHGKMKPAEKDGQMQLFVSGEAQIMVATTVIEVGVNVPNASVMIIENA